MRLYGFDNLDESLVTVAAPMAGVSDFVFRFLVRYFGADITFTEMISSQGLVRDNPNTYDVLYAMKETNEQAVAQLFGQDPQIMAEAAEIVLSLVQVPALDINMGCPVKKVVKTGAGSALMCNVERAADVVRALVEVARNHNPCPDVTVKIRTGWDAENINAPEFASRMQRAGAQAVCVHGRTRSMLYSGEADWDLIKKTKNAVDVPVVGNGDVAQVDDARTLVETTGCDAVMIGRAAVGNPWIFRELKYSENDDEFQWPSLGDRLAMAVFHTELEVAFREEFRSLPFMRHQLHQYFHGLPRAADMRDKVNSCESFEQLESLISDYADWLGVTLQSDDVRKLREIVPDILSENN